MKYIKILILFICILSCSSNNKKTNQLGRIVYEKYIMDKTFFRIENKDSKYLYKEYCDGVPKYIFYKNKYYLQSGEGELFDLLNIEDSLDLTINVKGIFSYLKKEDRKERLIQKSTISVIDTIRHLIKIDNDIYIDSLYTFLIPNIKQPCTECFEKEDCDEWAKQEKIQKETPKYTKQWQGTYNFEYGRTQMGETVGAATTFTVNKNGVASHTLGEVELDITDDKGDIIGHKKGRTINRKEHYNIVFAKKDTLKIVHSQNPSEEQVLYKDAEGHYFIQGSAYFIPAPDLAYPLTVKK